MFKRIAAVVLVLCVAACAAPRPRPVTPWLPGQSTASLQALPPPGEYQIDSSSSELRLLVYRAGSLSNLGHNHVMVNRAVTGQVRIGDGISASSFSLSASVNDFVVDDAQARSEEGGDFPSDIPEDAKQGTRRNMLGSAVLNAAEFPSITVKSVSLTGPLDALNAEVEISVAGHTSTLSMPFALQGDAHQLIAAGSTELRQSVLGLKPLSLLNGALQVQDAMHLKFKITALTN
ncbi:MAG TPA: YceI family protein [Steroidobacteraceae bacterium]|jgi:polyisoprenoid-binding protein YceI|nr:YceI family protein [Steroidobacteraceae bacterium]